jgi:ribosomal protein S8
MLQSIKRLYGIELSASDGEIGHVQDFYFDDQDWAVRYVVADTGSWLAGRQVLLSPLGFGNLDQTRKQLRVNLTRNQIENSPSIESYKPVSRQFEEKYHSYYGWPYYWQGGGVWGTSAFPIFEIPAESLPDKPVTADSSRAKRGDEHLRSTLNVDGYRLEASDGKIGCVCDFMIDTESWTIKQLVVKTGWLPGKEVEIPTSKIERMSYDESAVFVNLTGKIVERSPRHHVVLNGTAS